MKTGEERYLPARDRGPVKRFIRDYVDSRFSFVELMIPVLLATTVLAWSGNPTLASYGNAVLFGMLGAFLVFAAFRRALHGAALVTASVSVLAFLGLAWSVGGYNAHIARVITVDLVADSDGRFADGQHLARVNFCGHCQHGTGDHGNHHYRNEQTTRRHGNLR